MAHGEQWRDAYVTTNGNERQETWRDLRGKPQILSLRIQGNIGEWGDHVRQDGIRFALCA